MRLMIWMAVAWIALGHAAAAETRRALVVGNADYAHAGRLPNPLQDADLVADTLRSLGFEVTLARNLTRGGLARDLSAFLADGPTADLTVFYYAGHGMQFEGENYLLGTEARLETRFDVAGEAIPLGQVVGQLKRNSRALMAFIDACRNNPLADDFYRTNFSAVRAIATRGLAPVIGRHEGSMLMFAASPGQVAFDGQGSNSPFAAALARHLPAENVEILTAMKRVIRDVKSETGDQQVPMLTNDLALEVYLNLAADGAGAAVLAAQEEALFEAAQSIGTERAWDVFLDRFPQGALRDMARLARDEVAAQALAAAEGSEVAPDGRVRVSAEVARGAEDRLGLTSEEARAVQAALAARGYDPGPADGAIGPRTRRAIADFQAATGLPSTGVVSKGTAERLGIALDAAETADRPFAVSRDARRYDPKQLALIETDQRLVAAAQALDGREFIYGFFEGRIYIAVLGWNAVKFDAAIALAERAGGHLATISSAAENAFVYDMVRHDLRMWRSSTTTGQDRFGPAFGLSQLPGSREPDGGFVWHTGEPVTYANWGDGEPNNYDDNERIATFTVRGRNRLPETATGPWWSDMPDIERAFVIEIE